MWKAVLLLSLLCPLVNCAFNGYTNYMPVQVGDPGFKEAVDIIKRYMDNHTPSQYRQKILEITSAQKSMCTAPKFCGGIVRYRFYATAGMTVCLKNNVSYKDVDYCQLQRNTRLLDCTMNVELQKQPYFYKYQTSCKPQ